MNKEERIKATIAALDRSAEEAALHFPTDLDGYTLMTVTKALREAYMYGFMRAFDVYVTTNEPEYEYRVTDDYVTYESLERLADFYPKAEANGKVQRRIKAGPWEDA